MLQEEADHKFPEAWEAEKSDNSCILGEGKKERSVASTCCHLRFISHTFPTLGGRLGLTYFKKSNSWWRNC